MATTKICRDFYSQGLFTFEELVKRYTTENTEKTLVCVKRTIKYIAIALVTDILTVEVMPPDVVAHTVWHKNLGLTSTAILTHFNTRCAQLLLRVVETICHLAQPYILGIVRHRQNLGIRL